MMSCEEKIAAMKQRVLEANLALPRYGLVKLTWGNVSEVDRELGVIVIKPSGVRYECMQADQMVVTDLLGNIIEEDSLKPSSDLPTHVVLYQTFEDITAITHTHSTHSVMWAQAGRDLPAYGTTHADAFYGKVPCTRQLTKEEVREVPGVLVYGHGPFTWGDSPMKAVENSLILDEICLMAKENELINPNICEIPQYLLDKHYFRKHGKYAYYGQ